MDATWRGLAETRRLRWAQPSRHGVERIANVAYGAPGSSAHTLDVYRPVARQGSLLVVVLYIHGGGFRILSKDTHWVMGLAFARQNYVVFNINYRLAPRHPFPAAIEDAVAALLWVHANAATFGGDPSRVVVAGESAGANLATSLAVVTSYRRSEPWAREVFDRGIRLRAVLPACGLLHVTDTARFARAGRVSRFVQDRLEEVEAAYLPRGLEGNRDLADPLVFLERGLPPDAPLPPFFAGAGTWDVVVSDTRRLKAALDALHVRCDVAYYEGQPHAFHAFVWRPAAKAFWRDTFAFLRERGV
jgi:acetyl esterase